MTELEPDDSGDGFRLARPYQLPDAAPPGPRHRRLAGSLARSRQVLLLAGLAVVLVVVAAVLLPRQQQPAADQPGAPAAVALPTPDAGEPVSLPGTAVSASPSPAATTAGPVRTPTRGPSPAASATPRPGASSPRPAGTSPKPVPVTFTAVAGESCPGQADRGFRRSGWASDWYGGGGGWSGDGCGGASVSVPMTGSATADDADNVVVWWFRTGPVTRGTCAVSVHVPGTGHPLDSAGKPAHYQVYGSTDATGAVLATLDVDQTANQGRWVSAGSVAITGGQLSVRMTTRGVDWGPGRDGAHLGVSALKVSCKAA
ncbi:hypothetical protein Cs7R123_42710 [Catellatospora sp. TT07R-123]|uniref:hypothetical protein n=1 Tax=Catellatospora sp. TT07R-123 TaxID=2733863 RepID=UPI001AFEABE2|nr:hypothetical protein [Catellatospora sp. TT07R-123]GHJ46929.1 hypothetical protein Cs7R123_42710 [Catellatospora sp. TT07R-123]